MDVRASILIYESWFHGFCENLLEIILGVCAICITFALGFDSPLNSNQKYFKKTFIIIP